MAVLTGPRATPLHPSLTRPILLGGAERELVIIEGTTIVALSLGVGFHLLTLLLAAILATVGHSLLTVAAKADPQMLRVYTRHVRYQSFYLALAHPEAPPATVLPFDFGL